MAKKAVPETVVKLTPVKFSSVSEHWSEYALNDGSIVRIRPIITDVERHVGQFSPTGEPIYQVKAALIVEVKPKPKPITKSKKKS